MSISASTDSFISTQKSSLDALLSFASSSLNSIEKLNSLNLAATRNMFCGQLEGISGLLSRSTPLDSLVLHNSLAQPHIEKAVAYSSNLYDIATDAQEEFISLLETRQAELNKTLTSMLDGYAKASGGSEVAVAAAKTAISAANSAFDKAKKAARDVANLADTNVNATLQAVSAGKRNIPSTRKKVA